MKQRKGQATALSPYGDWVRGRVGGALCGLGTGNMTSTLGDFCRRGLGQPPPSPGCHGPMPRGTSLRSRGASLWSPHLGCFSHFLPHLSQVTCPSSRKSSTAPGPLTAQDELPALGATGRASAQGLRNGEQVPSSRGSGVSAPRAESGPGSCRALPLTLGPIQCL